MIKNFFALTLKSIRYRPIRSWLTILGIVIGVMLVVMIFALGSGIQNAVAMALQRFGSDFIIIFPGKETNPFLGLIGGQKFDEKDILNLEKIPGVRFVAKFNVAALNSEFRGEKKTIFVHAAPWKTMRPLFEESQGIKLDKGAWPTDEDANEVVAGYLAANELFKNKMRIGDEIIIQSKPLKIAGIITRMGSREDDNSLFMSWNLFHRITGSKPAVMSAFVKVEPGADIELVAKQIKYELSKQEVVHDFTVLTPEKALRLIGDVLSIIELVLIVIALISVVVGAVGIMNTMYTSVLERTKQIGIMKAIGASSDNVLLLFLLESGMIGLIGGVFGIILGVAVAYIIGLVAASLDVRGLFSFAALDFLGFLVVLFFTFFIGVISGLLPARQASKMEPAEALRYE